MSNDEAADRVAIRELIDAYAHCADRRDAEGQMALFTADTHFVVYMDARSSEPTMELRSQAELAPIFAPGMAVVAHEHVVRELALGQRPTLHAALGAMAERLGTPEVDHVLGRMSAAYEQGLPLGQALAAHAQTMRERQQLHIVEEGGKASVRMLLPVAVLILPVLFVVVLVPAAVELTHLGG